MTEKPKALDITILGRSYRVSCADDEREALLEAVDYVDRKMGEIKAAGRVASTERIAVMAALNIAHELLSAKNPGGFDTADARRRMAAMQATLDQALAPQEKLL
jgi:cell division protein ZapA